MGAMLFFAGYIITYTGFATLIAQYSYEEAPDLIEMFWQFCSPNVVLMALGMFLAVQRVKVTSVRMQNILAQTTKCSFGAYLMHYIFLGPVIIALQPLGLPTPLCVVLTVVIVFALCWSVTAAIYKFAPRVARYIVG
jgi:hypothetical protein